MRMNLDGLACNAIRPERTEDVGFTTPSADREFEQSDRRGVHSDVSNEIRPRLLGLTDYEIRPRLLGLTDMELLDHYPLVRVRILIPSDRDNRAGAAISLLNAGRARRRER